MPGGFCLSGFMCITHRSAGFAVVQIHGTAQISLSLVDVDEISREPIAERAVVAAAAPLPITRTCRAGGLARRGGACGRPLLAPASSPRPQAAPRPREVVVLAARTRVDGARAAGSSNRVCQRRARDGVDKRRLSAA